MCGLVNSIPYKSMKAYRVSCNLFTINVNGQGFYDGTLGAAPIFQQHSTRWRCCFSGTTRVGEAISRGCTRWFPAKSKSGLAPYFNFLQQLFALSRSQQYWCRDLLCALEPITSGNFVSPDMELYSYRGKRRTSFNYCPLTRYVMAEAVRPLAPMFSQ